MGKRPKISVPSFNGSLNPKEIIEWINYMGGYFKFEEIGDLDRVIIFKTILKGHASIWWREM